jgi:transcription elongation factor GreB
MARALLKKEVDSEVLVKTPTGEHLWFVTEIDYHGTIE